MGVVWKKMTNFDKYSDKTSCIRGINNLKFFLRCNCYELGHSATVLFLLL